MGRGGEVLKLADVGHRGKVLKLETWDVQCEMARKAPKIGPSGHFGSEIVRSTAFRRNLNARVTRFRLKAGLQTLSGVVAVNVQRELPTATLAAVALAKEAA